MTRAEALILMGAKEGDQPQEEYFITQLEFINSIENFSEYAGTEKEIKAKLLGNFITWLEIKLGS